MTGRSERRRCFDFAAKMDGLVPLFRRGMRVGIADIWNGQDLLGR